MNTPRTRIAINPKEKTRLRAIRNQIAAAPPDQRTAVARSFAAEELMWRRRCQSAEARSPIVFTESLTTYSYDARSGELYNAETERTVGLKQTTRNVWFQGKPAARILYALIHGEVPPDHEVYHVNNDPKDLSAKNLRTRKLNHYNIRGAIEGVAIPPRGTK